MSGRLETPDDGTEELARALLHQALRAQQGGQLSPGAVRAPLRALCDCARARGLPIESVLVTLKHEWREAPESRHLGRVESAAVLERLVSLCIAEFYADRPSPP